MKTEKTSPEDESLSKALQGWQVNAALPPRFEDGVWQRIERCERAAAAPWGGLLFAWLKQQLSRPALAAAYVALLVLIGLTAGYVRGTEQARQARMEARTQYVRMLDPYLTRDRL